MSDDSTSEDATQLFKRLLNKNNDKTQEKEEDNLNQLKNILLSNKTLNIDSKLFTNGPIHNKQLIEIFGKTTTGKSELIIHLISRIIVPVEWSFNINYSANLKKGITINLSEYSCQDKEFNEMVSNKVVLIDSDAKFPMKRLYDVLHNRIMFCCLKNDEISTLNSNRINKLVDSFVKQCMNKIVYFQCFTNDQFVLALGACDHFIQSQYYQNKNSINKKIIPIFVDSISANYETNERFVNSYSTTETNLTQKYTLMFVKKYLETYDCVIIVAKCDESIVNVNSIDSNSKTTEDGEKNFNYLWERLVNTTIELKYDLWSLIKKDFLYLNQNELNTNISNNKATSFLIVKNHSISSKEKDYDLKTLSQGKTIEYSIGKNGFFIF
jgi:RecA/RadA recombinase